MNRISLLGSISTLLARFDAEINILNQSEQFDINLFSEDILIPILNLTFDLDLVNANKLIKNHPAIDLVDIENRVAFQISSTATNDKIKHTVEQFLKHELFNKYDVLFIFIISSKDIKSLLKKEYTDLIDGTFEYDPQENVLNSATLYSKIKSLSLSKITKIEAVLKSEFSEQKIEERAKKSEQILVLETEKIYSNLLEISFPEKIFIAELSIDKTDIRKQIKEQIKNKERRYKKIISDRDIINFAINLLAPDDYCQDWTVSNDLLISFRDLHEDKALSQLVDKGTISEESVADYTYNDSDTSNIFKSLLGYSFKKLLKSIGIEWVHQDKIFRFIADRKIEKKVTWTKDKKAAPRTVIKEMWNKKEGHIICFRHLAFKSSFYNYEDNWYLSIAPTYSYTWDGKSKSKYESTYLSGIKKQEDNKAVYGHFRFLAHMLSKYAEEFGNDLFSEPIFPYEFKIKNADYFELSPIVDDEGWYPTSSKKANSSEGIQTKLL